MGRADVARVLPPLKVKTMTVRVDVWLDFSCPFSFLASKHVRLLERDCGLDVHWRSLLLRQPGAPPMSSVNQQIVRAEREHAGQIARSSYGLTLCPGPIDTDTLLAHIGTKYAEMHGQAGAFLAAAMNAYWLQGCSLAEEAVVQQLLRDIGIEGEIPLDPMDAWLLTDGIEVDRGLARAYDIYATPVLVFERKHVVKGLQPHPVLEQICARLESDPDGGDGRAPVQGVQAIPELDEVTV